jgi:hypothetical protein
MVKRGPVPEVQIDDYMPKSSVIGATNPCHVSLIERYYFCRYSERGIINVDIPVSRFFFKS